jgi:hypothetical protein
MASEIYTEMVEVDLLLCNENNPHGSEKMDARKHIEAMERVIDSWAEYELSKSRLRLSSNF